MSLVEEMLKKAVEEKNEERRDEVHQKVKSLVDSIVSAEAQIADLKERVKTYKAAIKELQLPEEVKVEL